MKQAGDPAPASAPRTVPSPRAPRPRVLLVVTLAETGGAQTYVRQLLPVLVPRYDVLVAAHGDGPLRASAAAAGAGYVELRHVRRDLDPVGDAAGLVELVRLFRRFRPTLVHLNSSKVGILGGLAAIVSRVPVCVFTAHGWAFKAGLGGRARLYRILHRAVRRAYTRVICVSESERRLGIDAGACTPEASLVIRNGVGIPAAATTHRDGGIVSITRLRPPKDTLTLVGAIARSPRRLPPLTIIGDGPDRPRIEVELARHGLGAACVQLLGDLDDPEPFLRDARVFVLSSRSEGMPMAVLEAMAAGLPVVATNVGGIPELVVDGETGSLVPPGDSDALAAALQRLADDPALAAAFGAAGRRRAAERFGIDGFRARHLELYEQLIAARRA